MPKVSGGPLVPARIWWAETLAEPECPENRMSGTRSRFLAAEIAGEVVDVDDIWLRRGEPITEKEYRFRMAELTWAKQHAPQEAIASPEKRVDLRQIPIPFS